MAKVVTEVLPRSGSTGALYLCGTGPLKSGALPEEAAQLAIVSCMPRTPPKAAQVAGARRMILALHKNKPIALAQLQDALAFIRTSREEGMSALVHCSAGKHRSASIVCAHLVATGVCRTPEEATAMVRKLRPIIRNDTEAPELWGSIQEQLPQCMRDFVTNASRGSPATIGRKRAADVVLPSPPQKWPALEVGCLVLKGRARFPNICASATGTLVALGTVGIKSERRVMARRSTDPCMWLMASMEAACSTMHAQATSLHSWRAATRQPRRWCSRVRTMAFHGSASMPPSCQTPAEICQTFI